MERGAHPRAHIAARAGARASPPPCANTLLPAPHRRPLPRHWPLVGSLQDMPFFDTHASSADLLHALREDTHTYQARPAAHALLKSGRRIF